MDEAAIALLDQSLGGNGVVIAAGLLPMVAVIVISEWRLGLAAGRDVGMTTAVSIIAVVCLGVYLAKGSPLVAAALDDAVAALLQFKPELHSIAFRLGENDMRTMIQFAVFSCVILPVFPDEQRGPLRIFNPFDLWLMVVLIVGISLAGYIAYKSSGNSAGVMAGGLLGGAISSTAQPSTIPETCVASRPWPDHLPR
jgi:uncharacterized membrane protein (DUF4010 family)